MNQFLADVIARNLGSAPAIRPRSPSFFEPDRNHIAGLAVLPELEVDPPDASMPKHLPRPRTVLRTFIPSEETSVPAVTRVVVKKSNETVSAFTRPTSKSSDAAPRSETEVGFAPQPVHALSLSDPLHSMKRESHVRQEDAMGADKFHQHEFALPERFREFSREQDKPDTRRSATQGVLSTKKEHAVNEAVFPSRAVRSETASPRIHAQPPQVSGEPAVNVTIGKVEVLAVLPERTSRPVARARARTTLSLDDYLKRRDRERR